MDRLNKINERVGKYRWTICALLFFATTINYLDRAILGVLLPEIRKQLDVGADVYGVITFVFQIFYAIGSLIGGKLLDKYGTRIGFGLAAALWSAAATLHTFAASALQFGLLRAMLGLGESTEEVVESMSDLRGVDCDILTLGQYLQPTREHLPVARYVHPNEFLMLKGRGLGMGFRHVESGPLVRSSYHAAAHISSSES